MDLYLLCLRATFHVFFFDIQFAPEIFSASIANIVLGIYLYVIAA